MDKRPPTLSETSPSTLNRTAFPLNAKKRLLQSPSSSTPSSNSRVSNLSFTKANHGRRKDVDGDADVDMDEEDDGGFLSDNELMKSNSQSSSHTFNKKVTLRRSTGLLNLSIEASPNTQRIINKSSKNDEMMKSFNELTFENSNDHKSVLSPTSRKSNRLSSIKIIHNDKKNVTTPITNNTKRSSDMQKKLEKTLEKYKDKISNATYTSIKKISPIKNENENKSRKPFKFNSLINHHTNESSPIKHVNRMRPFTTGSIHSTPLNESIKDSSPATPSLFESVKPLQTAFTSNGLQSKIGYTQTKSNKVMPDTPCKRQVKTVDLLNIAKSAPTPMTNSQYKNESSFDDSFTNSTNSFMNDSYGRHNYTANTTISQKISNNHKTSFISKPSPINTSDLQQCLLKFSNEFDDFSNVSIFSDNRKVQYEDGAEIWNENEKIPSTPNDKFAMNINLSSIQSNKFFNSNLNTPNSFKSIESSSSRIEEDEDDTPTKDHKTKNGGISNSNSSYWQRANSRNTSVYSLQNNSHPVFAPPRINTMFDGSGGGSGNNSPHTPVEFEFMKNNSSGKKMHTSTPSLVINNESKTTLKSCDTITIENKRDIEEHLFDKFGNCTLIGKGEFSLVYEVSFENMKYAVKRNKQKIPGPRTRLRKLEEVEILRSLRRIEDEEEVIRKKGDHIFSDGREHVLTLISAWEYNSYLYIMTDYCDNGSLDVFLLRECEISRSRLDEWRVWKIFVEIMLGVSWIHGNNILHLDLKPANILITFDGTLKIGDFGVGTKLPLTSFFDREGDREYIAPEIITRHEYTKAADIFSVGLIMVEVAANVVLPDNGTSWQKLRSGDLTDAGKLSSSDLSEAQTNSLFSHNSAASVPEWTPYWFTDGTDTLDRLVRWLVHPVPTERPDAADILRSWECGLVQLRRCSGATIYEGDYGPSATLREREEERRILMENGCFRVQDVVRGV